MSRVRGDSCNALKGFHGLRNQGATCYLNSVLQVLFMTEDFRKAVKRCQSECIDVQLDALFRNLKKRTAETVEVTEKLGIYKVNEQRDAAECFEKILTMASEEASQIFEGELTHRTICECGAETEENTPFWNLPLSLVDSSDNTYSVVDGIQDFFKESEITGDNQLYCEKCKSKRDAIDKTEIKHHPDVLMLLLKRFEFNYYQMTYVKNGRAVDVPITIEIPENQRYHLYAFVEHFGSLRCGHYTSTIKCRDGGTDQWHNFNDSSVTLLHDHPFNQEKLERSKSAYLLFYRKQETDLRNISDPPEKADLPLDNQKNNGWWENFNKIENGSYAAEPEEQHDVDLLRQNRKNSEDMSSSYEAKPKQQEVRNSLSDESSKMKPVQPDTEEQNDKPIDAKRRKTAGNPYDDMESTNSEKPPRNDGNCANDDDAVKNAGVHDIRDGLNKDRKQKERQVCNEENIRTPERRYQQEVDVKREYQESKDNIRDSQSPQPEERSGENQPMPEESLKKQKKSGKKNKFLNESSAKKTGKNDVREQGAKEPQKKSCSFKKKDAKSKSEELKSSSKKTPSAQNKDGVDHGQDQIVNNPPLEETLNLNGTTETKKQKGKLFSRFRKDKDEGIDQRKHQKANKDQKKRKEKKNKNSWNCFSCKSE